MTVQRRDVATGNAVRVWYLYKDPLELLNMLSTAELVARIREHSGDTQEALARRLGVSFPTINSWERGRSRPRRGHRQQLENLADELGIQHGFRVLVIDDDPATAEIVKAAATTADDAITVDYALDGTSGLIQCGALRPQLLFLDIMMPGINGLDVARRLRDMSDLDTRIFFVTSSRDSELIAQAERLAESVILKPLEIADLVETLQSALTATV